MARPIRTVVYVVLLLVAVGWLAARAAPPLATDEVERDVSAAEMDATLAALHAETARGAPLVIVLGDSSLRWHPPLEKNETLTAMLEAAAVPAGATIRVLARDGFDAVAYYLLVDEVAALRPAAVVLTANLQSFTDSWFRQTRMKHPQLAAFVRPTRVWRAMALPLEEAGIDDASLLLDPAWRALGVSDLPEKIDGYRTRIRERLDGVAAAGAAAALAEGGVAYAVEAPPAPTALPMVGTGRPQRRRAVPPTGTAPGGGAGPMQANMAFRFMDLYPAKLKPDQATVRVLGAAVRDLAARDVRTIVMLAPVHLQAAKLTGAYVQRDLPGAVRVISDEARTSGAAVVDLSEVLPEESFFIDRYTHFTAAGNRLVADRLVATLGPILTNETGR